MKNAYCTPSIALCCGAMEWRRRDRRKFLGAVSVAPFVDVEPTDGFSWHSTAMHLLQSGVDLTVRQRWLGHVQLATTHGYVEIDLEMKRKALAALHSAGRPGGWLAAHHSVQPRRDPQAGVAIRPLLGPTAATARPAGRHPCHDRRASAGRQHGYEALRRAVEQALEMGAFDVGAGRYLLEMERAGRRVPAAALEVSWLSQYERPQPNLQEYDQLLEVSIRKAQAGGRRVCDAQRTGDLSGRNRDREDPSVDRIGGSGLPAPPRAIRYGGRVSE